MPRLPRHFEPRSLVEVTTRTIHGRFLMRPGPVFNDIFRGVLGYAQATYGLDLHAYAALSNHYHLLCSPEDPEQLADFMRLFNSRLAREIGRICGWREKVWSRPYSSIVVSEEAQAQIARLVYVLSHGAKEGLVASPLDWPGPHCIRSLLEGSTAEGLWFNRTLEYEANRQGLEFGVRDFATVEVIRLSPLPCWRHLSEADYRARIAELLDQIEAQAAVSRAGREPTGAAVVLRQDPHDAPTRSKRTPAPRFHAATKAVRRTLLDAFRIFLDAYRRASERFRGGDFGIAFPLHCFPPPRPFTRGSPILATS
jgi:hypothetical protein